MDEPLRTAFLGNYQKFMMATFQDQKNKRQRNFREIMKDQVMALERSLLNRIDYKPYIFYS